LLPPLIRRQFHFRFFIMIDADYAIRLPFRFRYFAFAASCHFFATAAS
jgi:hypothetical protein